MTALIIYDSKYGATRQYAEWLSIALRTPVIKSKEVTPAMIEKADLLLLGTPVYYGKFRLAKWLKKNEHNLLHKKMLFFVVGGTSNAEDRERNKSVKASIPQSLLLQSEIYFLKGRLIHSQLSFTDRLMMKMAGMRLKDPGKRKAMNADLDGVSPEELKPLVNAFDAFSARASTYAVNKTL
ncbi:MAG: hypothetical protein KA821_16945 [Chitinophagaceae bacterium]|nr:hypothetical protein [Chitinophagaceae bacterium]